MSELLGRDRAVRAAENQSLFREVNERIGELAVTFGTHSYEWFCECAREDCFEQIVLTMEEYEAVRSQPDTFAVAPGDEHVFPEVERVTTRTNDYWIVQKVGTAGEVALAHDPRARQ